MGTSYDLTLKAEIVGVMEGTQKSSMKVLVKPLYLTLPANLYMHLGDTVLIDAELSVRSVEPDIEPEGEPPSIRR